MYLHQRNIVNVAMFIINNVFSLLLLYGYQSSMSLRISISVFSTIWTLKKVSTKVLPTIHDVIGDTITQSYSTFFLYME